MRRVSLLLEVAVLRLLAHRHACSLHSSVPCVFASIVASESVVLACVGVQSARHGCPTLTAQRPWVRVDFTAVYAASAEIELNFKNSEN